MPRDPPLPLRSSDGKPSLESLAAAHGTPYHLYDEAGIRDQIRLLLREFGSRLHGFRQYFAVKALPNPAVCALVRQYGCGLDCSSVAELHLAHLLGARGEEIMYTSNYVCDEDMAVAFDQGVIMNFDDVSCVASCVRVRGRVPDLVCFRLNPGVGRTDSETASNVLGGPSAKFGVPLEDIEAGYNAARAAGATRFGIHMMTGSCVLNDEYWMETVTILLDTVARLHASCGITFEFINIGGGLGIPYTPEAKGVDVPTLASRMTDVIHARVKAHALPFHPRVYMENGRFITGPFGHLVTTCASIKSTSSARYFGVDACMANLMRPGMYGAYHHITVPAREGGPRANAAVVGTLCENNDWFAKDRSLPRDVTVGDLVVIHDAGAHSYSMGFNYNGKLRAVELLLRADGVTVDVVRDRETLHSLYDNAHMPRDIESTLATPFPYAGRARTAAHVAAEGTPVFTSTVAGPSAARVTASHRTISMAASIVLATAAAAAAVMYSRRRAAA